MTEENQNPGTGEPLQPPAGGEPTVGGGLDELAALMQEYDPSAAASAFSPAVEPAQEAAPPLQTGTPLRGGRGRGEGAGAGGTGEAAGADTGESRIDFYERLQKQAPKIHFSPETERDGKFSVRMRSERIKIKIDFPDSLIADLDERNTFFDDLNTELANFAQEGDFKIVYNKVELDTDEGLFETPLSGVPIRTFDISDRLNASQQGNIRLAYEKAVKKIAQEVLRERLKNRLEEEGGGVGGGGAAAEIIPIEAIEYAPSSNNRELERKIRFGGEDVVETISMPDVVLKDPSLAVLLVKRLNERARGTAFGYDGKNLSARGKSLSLKLSPNIVTKIRSNRADELHSQEKIAVISGCATLADDIFKSVIEEFKKPDLGIEEEINDKPTIAFTVGEEEISRAISLGGTGGRTASGPIHHVSLPPELRRNAQLCGELEAELNRAASEIKFAFTGSEIIPINRPAGMTIEGEPVSDLFKTLYSEKTTKEARYKEVLLDHYLPLTERLCRAIVEDFQKRRGHEIGMEALAIPRAQYSLRGSAVLRSLGGAAVEPANIIVPDEILKSTRRRTDLGRKLGALFSRLPQNATLRQGKTLELTGLPDEIPVESYTLSERLFELNNIPATRRTPAENAERQQKMNAEMQDIYDRIATAYIAQFDKRTRPDELEKLNPIAERVERAVEVWGQGEDRRLRLTGWLSQLPGVNAIKRFFGAYRSDGTVDNNSLNYRRWTTGLSWGLLAGGLALGANPAMLGAAGILWGIRRVLVGTMVGTGIFETTGRWRDKKLRQGDGTLAPQEHSKIKEMCPEDVIRRMADIQVDCRTRLNTTAQAWVSQPTTRDDRGYDGKLRATYERLQERFQEILAEELKKEAETFSEGMPEAARERALDSVLNSRLAQVNAREGRTAFLRLGGTITRGLASILAGTAIGSGALAELVQRAWHGKVPLGAKGGEIGPVGTAIHRVAGWFGIAGEDWYQKQFKPFWHGTDVPPSTTTHIPVDATTPDGKTGTGLPASSGAAEAGEKPSVTRQITVEDFNSIDGKDQTPAPASEKPPLPTDAAEKALESHGDFKAKHPLLFGEDSKILFEIIGDGKLQTDIRGPEDLQRTLRRLVMDGAHISSFTGIDAGKVENSVANLYKLLQGKDVAGFSAHEVSKFLERSPDGRYLTIKNYDELAEFINSDLMGHAHDLAEKGVINNASAAVHYGTHTSPHVWGAMLEAKHAAGTGPGITVDFSDVRGTHSDYHQTANPAGPRTPSLADHAPPPADTGKAGSGQPPGAPDGSNNGTEANKGTAQGGEDGNANERAIPWLMNAFEKTFSTPNAVAANLSDAVKSLIEVRAIGEKAVPEIFEYIAMLEHKNAIDIKGFSATDLSHATHPSIGADRVRQNIELILRAITEKKSELSLFYGGQTHTFPMSTGN